MHHPAKSEAHSRRGERDEIKASPGSEGVPALIALLAVILLRFAQTMAQHQITVTGSAAAPPYSKNAITARAVIGNGGREKGTSE
jgi:hypothetical protein